MSSHRLLTRGVTRRGFALAAVLVFTVVIILTGSAFITMGGDEMIDAKRSVLPVQAMYLAEGGCEWGKLWLSSQPYPPSGTDPIGFNAVSLGSGKYHVTVDPDDNNPNNYLKRYEVRAVGSVVDPANLAVVRASKTLALVMSVESFAKYSYFTNNEYNPDIGTTIWFFGSDVLNGPVHSNSQINISGSPQFLDKVTSTANAFNWYSGGPPTDNPTFAQGYQLNADVRNMDQYKNMTRLQTVASTGGLTLTADYSQVQFNSNGTVSYRRYVSGAWTAWVTTGIPTVGVIYTTGHCYVSGTVRGQVTLAAAAGRDIYVTDNVTYSVDPTNPSCTDMLGLVAGRSVVVQKSSPAGGDLTIHASIMAFEKSFIVQNYSTIPVMGNLNVYGGVIQNYRGPVGTFYASTGAKASGYSKNYRYDTRMKTTAPPYFPATGVYELKSWDEGPTTYGD